MKRANHARSGLSMVEVMIAAAVLVIALVPLFAAIATHNRASLALRKKIAEANAGDALLEIISAKKWDENTLSPNQYLALGSATPPGNFGVAESGESLTNVSDVSAVDDIDDFNGYVDVYMDVHREVSVDYVVANQTNSNDPLAGGQSSPTRTKRVIVECYPVDNPEAVTRYVRLYINGISY